MAFVTNNDNVSPFQKHLGVLTALRGNRAAQAAYIRSVTPAEPVVKTAVEKHAETVALVNKRVTAVLKAATATDLNDAYRQVFAADENLYYAYRQATTVNGPMPQAPRDGMQKAAAVSSAYQEAQRLAAQMKKDDVYGKFKDMNETQMISAVFAERPDLYRLYRDEVLSQK